jgi:hypothetical protein
LQNPFTLTIARKKAFCNREKEISELVNHARNGNNVVLISPRRFGKTSLIQIVLEKLEREGILTAYVDLFPISSEKDLVIRFSEGLFKGIGRGTDPRTIMNRIKNIFKRVVPSVELKEDGVSFQIRFDSSTSTDLLLDDVMEGLYRYIKKQKLRACIALDEFQEITELSGSRRIEAILRSHIQMHQEISYFFIGSRRRVIRDMFTDRNRPFYKSSFLYTLTSIPKDKFVKCITDAFMLSKKKCSSDAASLIYDLTEGYPYYVQKLSLLAWDMTENSCNINTIKKAFNALIESDKADFENIWSGLTMSQKSLLKAMAVEPTSTPYSKEYLSKHGLSVGGTQKALKVLLSKDIIEKDNEGVFKVTDPIFKIWLRH